MDLPRCKLQISYRQDFRYGDLAISSVGEGFQPHPSTKDHVCVLRNGQVSGSLYGKGQVSGRGRQTRLM